MKVELTEDQLNSLYQLVVRASISGNDAEMIVSIKQALAKAAQSQDTEEKAQKRGATSKKN